MDKTQFQTLISMQVKIIYSLLAAFGLTIIALLDLFEEQSRFAAIAAGFALLLVLYAVYLLLHKQKRASPYPEWLLVGLLLLFTLFEAHNSEEVVHWIYFVPIYTFFLIPFRFASIALVIYSVVITPLILHKFALEVRWQVLATYAACLAFSFMYALLNERNNRYLGKIINTDPITQVYNEHQLRTDLNKEVTRANRQGSQLNLLSVSIPSAWHEMKLEELEQKLSELSRCLRNALRQYDSCYRLNSNDFVVLLPQANNDSAQKLQQELQQAVNKNILGGERAFVDFIVTLPEDDVDSLLSKVKGGVHEK